MKYYCNPSINAPERTERGVRERRRRPPPPPADARCHVQHQSVKFTHRQHKPHMRIVITAPRLSPIINTITLIEPTAELYRVFNNCERAFILKEKAS